MCGLGVVRCSNHPKCDFVWNPDDVIELSTETRQRSATSPVMKEYVFQVACNAGEDAELISLIAQALDVYPKANHKAAAAWLNQITTPENPEEPLF